MTLARDALARPRVLLDCDGVLCDFVSGFLGVVRDQLGMIYRPEEITEFSLWRALGLSKEEFDLCSLHIHEPGFCESLKPYKGAWDGVARLYGLASVYVVTSPWNSCPTWTYERERWLKFHFNLDHGRVVHTSAKHLVSGDFLVDDKTSTLEDWQAAHPSGVAVQWITPHNRKDGWTGRATNSWDELCSWMAP